MNQICVLTTRVTVLDFIDKSRVAILNLRLRRSNLRLTVGVLSGIVSGAGAGKEEWEVAGQP